MKTMKNKSLFWITMILIGVLGFASCSDDDDNDLPEFLSVTLSDDNAQMTLVFSEPVYANNDKTGALDASDFQFAITGTSTVEAQYTVAHMAGSPTLVINLEILSAVTGDEAITIQPADNASIYDGSGEAMLATDGITTASLAQDLGIIGEWESYDVSVLLSSYYDDIEVTFNANQTYTVTTYKDGISSTLEGTYTQEKSGVGNIWNITLNQTEMNGSPSELTSDGIFEIYEASPDSMWYEVAQTNPEIAGVTAPTAEAGFGSTSNGAYSTWNIQKYTKK